MSEEGFQITVSRPDAGAMTWRAIADDGTVKALLPDGSSVDVARSGDALADLAALAEVLPDITWVPPGERVEIECSATVAAVLPLWLRPDVERSIDGNGAACSDDVEDQMSWATVSLDHCVYVNGEQWAVIWAMA